MEFTSKVKIEVVNLDRLFDVYSEDFYIASSGEVNYKIEFELREWGIKDIFIHIKDFNTFIEWEINMDYLSKKEISNLERNGGVLLNKRFYGALDIGSDYTILIQNEIKENSFRFDTAIIDVYNKQIKIT